MPTALFRSIERFPAFDMRSVVIYSIIAAEAVAAITLSALLGFSFDPALWHFVPPSTLLLLFAGPLARRVGHNQVGGAIETLGLIYVQGVAAVFLLFPLTAISAPLADESLNRIDQAFGFDWAALYSATRQSPFLVGAIEIAYRSFSWQPAVVVILLWAVKQGDRAWAFVTAATIALLLCVVVFPFAPAEGEFLFRGLRPSDYPLLMSLSPWRFGPPIIAIKDGARFITADHFTGFVSMPSYHAASAALLCWATWRTPLRWLFVAINLCMTVAAMIVGAHYLVDILAGLAVGGLAIRLGRYSNDAP